MLRINTKRWRINQVKRRWQLKMLWEGRCRDCGKPLVTASHCEHCRVRHNKAVREYQYKIRRMRNGTV